MDTVVELQHFQFNRAVQSTACNSIGTKCSFLHLQHKPVHACLAAANQVTPSVSLQAAPSQRPIQRFSRAHHLHEQDRPGKTFGILSSAMQPGHAAAEDAVTRVPPPTEAQTSGSSRLQHWPVALYLPNLIGYLRIALLLVAVALSSSKPQTTFWLFVINFVLDACDGTVARRTGQVSSFGAFLDVLIDNLSRGVLWIWAFPRFLGLTMVMLEMTVFVCTHKGGGKAWKDGCFRDAPRWVKWVMANNFRTPQGTVVVAGLMGLPLWAWASRSLPGTIYSTPWLCWLFLPGRLMALAVELWIVSRHLQGLIQEDQAALMPVSKQD